MLARAVCWQVPRYISEWCMLDVFGVAMLIYHSEDRDVVPLLLQPGGHVLSATALLFNVNFL